MMSSVTAGLADSLTSAVLDQNDPETVRQGAPAYLLLIDGLIADNPKNLDLLLAGASLYSSYAGAFVDDPERASRLSLKGRNYGWAALCRGNGKACEIWTAPYDEFERVIHGMGRKDVPVLFSAGAAWAVDAIMQRVVALDETHEGGSAFLYLGILATLLPEASGGNPEQGRADFERVIELSGGKNLMAKVLLARSYARLVFDRDLHDRLCREVIEADPVAPGLTLTNTMAQEEAKALLESSEDYFGD
jgi:hypothetical protein